MEGDFLIQLPPTTGGDSVLNLSEKSDTSTNNGCYLIGYPVVTDDEGNSYCTSRNILKNKTSHFNYRRYGIN